MNLLSYNIRGGGINAKRKRISYLIQSGNIDLCFIQESKFTSFDESLAWSIWGNKEVEWTTSNSRGSSGDMILFWKKNSLTLNFSFIDNGYVGINTEWKGGTYNFINIYAPCNASYSSWRNLLSRKQSKNNEEWCLTGVSDEVCFKEERLGVGAQHSYRDTNHFKSFIEDIDLEDILCICGRFTWCKGNGPTMSRLDRFLLTSQPISEWNVINQRVGNRDISNHCPIWLNL